MLVVRPSPGLEAEPGGERPEDRPLEDQPGEDEAEGEGDGVEEVAELGKLPRLDHDGLVVGQLRTVEAVPAIAGWQPDVFTPEPFGECRHHT